MADLANLRTASVYINNQLLSRGLLRDGHAIDFAAPAPDAATMGRILGVVNDLILRRDRDATHRENLSAALREVRADAARQAADLQRARDQAADAARRAALGDAVEAGLRAQLASLEATLRKHRDDAARVRQLVAQTRAACAHEVRKRDRQIDGLKRAVADAGRARGERRSPAVTTITVGETTMIRPASTTVHAGVVGTDETDETDDPLRAETNAFLAALARSLSEDNEALLQLVQNTSHQLKTMSGYDEEEEEEEEEREENDNDDDDTPAPALADTAALARDLEAVLEHLRTILTNPSFVPIEEVLQRESEIGRLRDGWVKMEGRWKEAVHLLDGWRRRMAAGGSGRPVEVEEIQMGLRLSPVRVRSVAETEQGGLDLRLPPVEEEGEGGGLDEEEGMDEGMDLEEAADHDMDEEFMAEQAVDVDDVDVDVDDSDSDTSSVLDNDVQPAVEPLTVLPTNVDTAPATPTPSRTTKEVLRPSGAAGNRGAARAAAVGKAKTTATATTTSTTDTGKNETTKRAPPAVETARRADARRGPQRARPVAKTAPARASASASAATTTTSAASVKNRTATKPETTATAATTATTATKTKTEKEMPPPPPPPLSSSTGMSGGSAKRARSQSPSKIATLAAPPSSSATRLPLPDATAATAAPPPPSPALNMQAIAAKLAASEREADAARVRAKLKAMRGARGVRGSQGARSSSSSAADAVKADPAASLGDPVKRRTADVVAAAAAAKEETETASAETKTTSAPPPPPPQDEDAPPRKRRDNRRASKVASRRRSTLSPWELASLMGGGGGA